MKIQLELELDLSAKATYRDGQAKLSVSGSMPYGGSRTATATIEGSSDKTTALFIKAFEALIAEQQEQAVKLTQAARAECVTAAARMGEL